MAIGDDVLLAEQVLANVKTPEQVAEELRKALMARRRRQRRGGRAFAVNNLLTEDDCNYILEDGTGVYLLEPC